MKRRCLGELGSPKPGFRHRSAQSPALGRGVRGAWTQGQQRSIAHTHRIQDTGTCLGPEEGQPAGLSAGGSAGQRAQQAPRRGLHRTAASRDRIRARPRPPPELGRSSRGAARGRGWRVSQRAELQSCGAPAPEPSGPPIGRTAASAGKTPRAACLLSRCPTWATSLGVARNPQHRGASRVAAAATQVSLTRLQPTRPACRYLSPRAALPTGNLRHQGSSDRPVPRPEARPPQQRPDSTPAGSPSLSPLPPAGPEGASHRVRTCPNRLPCGDFSQGEVPGSRPPSG